MSHTQEKTENSSGENGLNVSLEQLEAELKRTRSNIHKRHMLRSIIFGMILAAAAVVILSAIWLPIIRISGNSMSPVLQDGQLTAALRGGSPERGEIIAFYFAEKTLVKRVIGCPGDSIYIDESGIVYVNGNRLNEPYVAGERTGETTTAFPLTVPAGRYFVLGDNRVNSLDSRNSTVGCISEDRIIGKIIISIWPLRVFRH